MTLLTIDIWSDIACPWCYIGKRRLEAALARFEHRGEVSIHWRSFELDPAAPRVKDPEVSYADRLAKKYSTSREQAETMIRTMTEAAAAEGLDFRFDRIRPGNTFDAHRMLHYAAELGKQPELKERLLCAYMTEGQAIGDRHVLATLLDEIGLDGGEALELLSGDAYRREVREDEKLAHANGVSGVPFFVAGRHGSSGAQPAELLLQLIERGWEEVAPAAPLGELSDGPGCGPDACEPPA